MKALYIVTAYPREAGDVITPWLVELIRRLRGRGVEVEVLAPSYRGLGDQLVEGVRVHRFRYAPAAWETLTHDQTAPDRVREHPQFLALVPSYVAAGSLAAARLARSGEFDLVHAFWPLPHGVFGLAAKRASGVPLISTFFGVELSWMESQLGVLRPVVRRIVRSSAAVTVISSHTRAAVERVAPDARVEVIPFGAAVELRNEITTSPRSPEAPFRLLFVGRLVERKGVRVLLDALARVEGVEVQLRVVGDGPERQALERHARQLEVADRVRFEGFISREELEQRFTSCDAFVLPAVVDAKGDTEGLGVVLLEAMSFAKPVIASAAGGIVDIVRPGETGMLVPPNDPDALAGAIRACAGDPELCRRMGAEGRRDVSSRFSWEAIAERVENVYRAAVRSPRGTVG